MKRILIFALLFSTESFAHIVTDREAWDNWSGGSIHTSTTIYECGSYVIEDNNSQIIKVNGYPHELTKSVLKADGLYNTYDNGLTLAILSKKGIVQLYKDGKLIVSNCSFTAK